MSGVKLDERGVVVACASCGQKNRMVYERLGETVRCGRCKHDLEAPAVPIEVADAKTFYELVTNAALPVVVDYWAPWCGPCRMVAPEIQKVAARQAGRALVVKVNTDEVPELGDRYQIRSIPTIAVFAGGKEVTRTMGARPAADIEQFVEQAAHAAR